MRRQRRPVPATWVSYRDALRLLGRGVTVPTAVPIAGVVGTWLSVMNQGSAILDGRPPWLKIVVNYATPFVVASLGYVAARRRRAVAALVALLDRDDEGEG